MDILGTKDRNEREDEEAERLVRPLPKLKPPRKDRRREEMQVDRDSDVEGDPDTKSDPDLSLNRREVGGSVNPLRKYVRLVMAEADAKMVSVRRKEDDQVVRVSEETLHGPDASKYEKVEKEESDPKPTKYRKPRDEQPSEIPPGWNFNYTSPDTSKKTEESKGEGKPKGNPSAPEGGSKPKGKPEDESKPKGKPKGKEKPKTDEEKAGELGAPPPPKRRVPTDSEWHVARSRLNDTFPDSIADQFLGAHPDDIHALINNYNTAKELSTKLPPDQAITALANLSKSGSFTLDPMQVKPPKDLLSSGSPEDQAEAMQRYRMEQVALNLAVRNHALTSMSSTGVSAKVAQKIVDHNLRSGSMSPEDQKRASEDLARDLISGVEDPPEVEDERFGVTTRPKFVETSRDNRKKALGAIAKAKNPEVQMMVVASFQGEDLKKALSDFQPSKDDTASTIASKLKRANTFFSDRSKDYPKSATSALDDPYQVFRVRVLHSLSTLDPKVASKVRRHIAKEEVREYDAKQRVYEKALRDYQKRLEKPQGGSEALVEPKPPVKPAGYDLSHPSTSKDPTSLRGRINSLVNGESEAEPSKVTPPKESTPRTASLYSSYRPLNCQMGKTMPSRDQLQRTVRTALYHGIQPYKDGVPAYVGWEQARASELSSADFSTLLTSAKVWLKTPVLAKSIEGMLPDSRFRAALDLAIRDAGDGKYSSVIDSNTYNILLAKLAGESQTGTLLTTHSASNQPEGIEMTTKFAKEDAAKVLSRLDRIAGFIQENAEKWGMPFEAAKGIVNDLDSSADEIEKAAFGEEHFAGRQVAVLKSAKVLQQDSDEGYMGTFNAPTKPIQTDSDEGYMSLFKDDQTEAVINGKSTVGRPLAP